MESLSTRELAAARTSRARPRLRNGIGLRQGSTTQPRPSWLFGQRPGGLCQSLWTQRGAVERHHDRILVRLAGIGIMDPNNNPSHALSNTNSPPPTRRAGQTDCQKDAALGYTMLNCYLSGTTYMATFVVGKVDGNPLFFPIDADPFSADQLEARKSHQSSRSLRRNRNLAMGRGRRGKQAYAQLQFHQRGPLLVPLRQDQELHP